MLVDLPARNGERMGQAATEEEFKEIKKITSEVIS